MNLERETVYCDRDRGRKKEKLHFAMLLYMCLLNSEIPKLIAIGHCQGAGQEQAL